MEFLNQSLKDLFEDLHSSGLWDDQKAISDSVLLQPPEEICRAYEKAKAEGEVDLHAFYCAHFRPVRAADSNYRSNPEHSASEHIAALWPHLTRPADDPHRRSTRYPLPRPYVVVGGRFQEAYYWDSYFTQLGLLRAGDLKLVRNMLDNFAHVIHGLGFIPNGFRSYYLSRSQPPFFALMVQDYGMASGDLAGALSAYRAAIETEYAFFINSHHNEGGLARYWDSEDSPRIEMYGSDIGWKDHAGSREHFYRDLRSACESGWDFSSRWLSDPCDLGTIRTTEIWPVDLNCLLLRYEEILAQAMEPVDPGRAAGYRTAAEIRRARISTEFFNEETGYFHDLMIADGSPTPVVSAAGLFPLFVGAATQDQALRALACMQERLLRTDGLLTTDIESGQQWDAPNGWAPLQWIAIRGLQRYGFDAEAADLRTRWLKTCESVYRATGKFVEKYNVIDCSKPSGGGEYELQDGFGWTNGVYMDLLADQSEAGNRPSPSVECDA